MKPAAILSVATGVTAAVLATASILQSQQPAPAVGAIASSSSSADKEIAALRAEIEILKAKACDQSHVMKDVAYHFGNLWFAGSAGNWPLATGQILQRRNPRPSQMGCPRYPGPQDLSWRLRSPGHAGWSRQNRFRCHPGRHRRRGQGTVHHCIPIRRNCMHLMPRRSRKAIPPNPHSGSA